MKRITKLLLFITLAAGLGLICSGCEFLEQDIGIENPFKGGDGSDGKKEQ